MINELTGLPQGVVGFQIDGEVHADDYKNTLIPAVERQIATHGEVRIVLVFPEFSGYSGGAAWQDLKMGTEHLTKWERIALVTDLEWMLHMINLFGWMTPGKVKTFSMAERDAAISWAAED